MADSGPTGRGRLARNVAANWVGFAAQLVAAFFVSPVLVHGLGDRRYGIWSLVESVLAYLMLFDLGVAASVVRYVARFDATRDQDALNRVFSASVCIFAVAGGAILAVTLAVAFPAFLLPQSITLFAVAGRLVEYAKDSLRVATMVLTPAVSALEARGDSATIRRVLIDSTRYVLWLILPVQLGLLLLGRPFLLLWMGPEYAELSYPTLAILALPLSLALSQSVSARILYGTG